MTAPFSSQRVTIVPRSLGATPVYLDDASLQVIADQVGGGSSPESLPSQPTATPASADSLVGIDASAGSLVRLFPLSSNWRLGRLGIGADPLHKMHIVGSGAAEKDLYISHTLASGTGLAATYRPVDTQVSYTATDIATTVLAWSGVRSGVTFGAGGVGATGKAHNFTGDLVVEGAGDANNEYGNSFLALRFDIGTGYTQTAGPTGRGWLTDWNVHGPIGVRPDLLNGLTLFFNNHYNGSPADSPAGGIWLVTRKGSGGASDATHVAASTYPIDVGLGIVGDSNAGASAIGWTKAIQIGGFGSGWKESGTSYIGTGIDLSEFATYGIHIHDRHASGTGPAIAVAANGGPVVIGGTAALDANSKLEVLGGTGADSSPLLFLGQTAGSRTYSVRLRNGVAQHTWGVTGGAGVFLAGTAAGDAVLTTTTSGKALHLGGTTKVVTVTTANTLGFFAATPVARQTGGAATAGAAYSTTEQTMLQTVYDALRAYGLLT